MIVGPLTHAPACIDPAWTPEQLETARRMWTGGTRASTIRDYLKLHEPRDLNRVAQWYCWPQRGVRLPVGKPRGPKPKPLTPELVALARQMYEAQASLRDIARRIGLPGHQDVTRLARREGWPIRKPIPPRRYIAGNRATLPGQEPERVRRRLAQACPGCGYRVAPNATIATLRGDDWWHKGCTPAEGDRGATGPFRAKSGYRSVSSASDGRAA